MARKRNTASRKHDYIVTIILSSLIAAMLLFIATILLSSSHSVVKLDAIHYQETSNVDYKVYLKENEFFTEDYLEKNMTYVANLIKNIDVNFNYRFDIDRESNLDIEYKIVGKLSITSNKDNSVFFEREYTLLEPVKETISGNNYELNKNIVIDYDYYNGLANRFKYNYGLDSNSKLTVYLEVIEKSNNENEYELSNTGTLTLNIPLTEKAVNVNLDYMDVNKKQKILIEEETNIYKRRRFVISLVFLGIAGIIILNIIRLFIKLAGTKSKYDIYINKLLREYDRFIVNTSTSPNTKNLNIIVIDTFNELLDARDNTKGAIKYYVVEKHEKSIFYFTDHNDIYMLTLEAKNFDK